MQGLSVKQIGQYKLFYYNDEWQTPVITEYNIFKLFHSMNKIPSNYIAFPWASLIDRKLTKLHPDTFTRIKFPSPCFTVIQHIHFRKLIGLFKQIGITHIFASHTSKSDTDLSKQYDINIIAFPLYPAQYNNTLINTIENRQYYASFIGQYEDYYISKIRLNIFEIFTSEKYYVKRRDKWHYWDMVYGKNKTTNEAYEKEYKDILANSIFSLCPSGSGPNSIRIWESMSYGTIPIILADTLILPQIKNINYSEFFIIWTEEHINILPNYIESLIKNRPDKIKRMMHKNIEIYNKYFNINSQHEIINDYFAL